ncbi:hypothetical protein [Nonomuraea cavernae]|uniref:hypothetical protein n=1 Tax=Nonomuraea cavernae TaxID=2045107 RepID=UPI0033E607E6
MVRSCGEEKGEADGFAPIKDAPKTMVWELALEDGLHKRFPFAQTMHAEHDLAARSEDIIRNELGGYAS